MGTQSGRRKGTAEPRWRSPFPAVLGSREHHSMHALSQDQRGCRSGEKEQPVHRPECRHQFTMCYMTTERRYDSLGQGRTGNLRGKI